MQFVTPTAEEAEEDRRINRRTWYVGYVFAALIYVLTMAIRGSGFDLLDFLALVFIGGTVLSICQYIFAARKVGRKNRIAWPPSK